MKRTWASSVHVRFDKSCDVNFPAPYSGRALCLNVWSGGIFWLYAMLFYTISLNHGESGFQGKLST